jgi:uncharacterized protein YecE (DUF72 family)
VGTTYLKIVCCGFPLPKIEYAERFPVVEVQQTFYEPPMISTLQRWRTLVPSDFEFTLKAWQLITHTAKSPTFRRLKTKLTPSQLEQCGSFQMSPMILQAWEKTRACAEALSARHVLFQCPASFTCTPTNIDQMRAFFGAVDRHGLTFLWEPRGSWPEDRILSLCLELDLVHVVDPFVARIVTNGLIYFRLHGGKNFRQIFTGAELQHVAGLIPAGRPAYVMFNNISMLNDAIRFQAEEFQ